jgi:hypothetical protein
MMTVDEADKYSLVDCMGSEISTAQDNLGYALGTAATVALTAAPL